MSTTATEPAKKPLRILIVINLEWNPHLGAVRIYMELAEQWQSAGHVVEHFSLSEAFSRPHRSAREAALRRFRFPAKAAAFIRKNAHRFDIIDALIGSLSASKKSLGFDGLLVARSVGSHHLYDRFERNMSQRWPGLRAGTFAGKVFHSALYRSLMRASDSALGQADLVNVPNEHEAVFLRDEAGVKRPVIVQPYGLTAESRRALAQGAAPPCERLKRKKVTFIGMWSPRKGSRDWAAIVRHVRRAIPDSQFAFLGTMVENETVLGELDAGDSRGIEVVPEFSPANLPKLLSDGTVGALPSYVEGFGLAILEQLAAGIPTVAFDAGGPRDILRAHLSELLVPVGDVSAFARNLIRILQMNPETYEEQVNASLKTANQFSWTDIAGRTLESYRAASSRARRGANIG